VSTLLFGASLLGLLLAVVLMRADPRRRENQLLTLAVLIDVVRASISGTLDAHGADINGAMRVEVCLLGRILLIYPLLEFAYASPLGTHDREVRVDSAEGGGSTFTILLPA